MSDHFDSIVAGGGVVGLAIGRELALRGRTVVVLERRGSVGTETSARNSEVIHAGIYYPAGSLKARLCVRGKALLYRYLAERSLPHERCGKLIVAVTANEQDRLAAIESSAIGNGVTDLQRLDAGAARELEPEVTSVGALFSPSTGILDTHALMHSFVGDIENSSGIVAPGSDVTAIVADDSAIVVNVRSGDQESTLSTGLFVNAAGLGAPGLAAKISGIDAGIVPRQYLAKGNYFALQGKSPFRHLIYPLPVDGGLGIHATLDLGHRVRFGPDVEWCDSVDYAVDAGRAESFYAAIRTWWPAVRREDLAPGYAGIRPKLSGPGDPVADFSIAVTGRRRDNRLLQLFGIESPGLTSSLAIGEYVADLADG